MKKIFFTLSLFTVLLMLTGTLVSSSHVTLKGTYENGQIKLVAFNSLTSWFTRRKSGFSNKIEFTITAKPGYKLAGKHNMIIYYGFQFWFKPEGESIRSYTKGIATATGEFIKSSVFTLRYFVLKDGKRTFVLKKLKMVRERPFRGSHDNVKMIITELN